jgi:hypothetical protein
MGHIIVFPLPRVDVRGKNSTKSQVCSRCLDPGQLSEQPALKDGYLPVPDFIGPTTKAMRTSSERLAASIFIITFAR